MKIAGCIILLCLFMANACTTGKSSDKKQASKNVQKPYSVWMADSDIKRNPKGWMIDFREKPKWEYTHGLMMSAYFRLWERNGNEKYLNYIKAFADFMIDEQGNIKTYEKEAYNIDRVNPGKFLIDLYGETKTEKYKLAIEQLRDQMRHQPRTSEGGFWHKKRYPHQMWLDGLYMGAAFLAKYAHAFNEPDLYNDVAKQIILIDKHTWNDEVGLFHHGWDESRKQKWADPETGRSPGFWGRAMGWYAMAMVDALDYFPEDHPKRDEILEIVKKMANAIVTYQDEKSGVWWQVPDQGGREGNYLESSASCMFVYFLKKASMKGYIDEKYAQAAQKGYSGILTEFIEEEEDGTISITHAVSVSGLGGDPYRDGTYAYYISEPQRANDAKAVGPFIMASLLFEK